jgi:hypothetical protein
VNRINPLCDLPVRQITVGDTVFTVLFPDLLRPLSPRERADLRDSIRTDGIRYPPLVTGAVEIIDGFHRIELAAELGMADVPFSIISGRDHDYLRRLALRMNVCRRHLSLEELQVLRGERIERVAESRLEGKSTRQIAEEEGVSQKQVRLDLEKATEEGYSVEPKNGRVNGRDGKSRPAHQATEQGCSVGPQASGGPPGPPETPTDQNGEPIPEKALPAWNLRSEFRRICSALDQLAKDVHALGVGPAGRHFHAGSALSQLKNARTTIWASQPSHVCPDCKGQKSRCRSCGDCKTGENPVGVVSKLFMPDKGRSL